MPTEIFGLPLHPMAVHLPVVLVPLLSLAALAYVLVPRARRHTGWLLVALTLVAPAVVFVARWSGQQLAQQQLAQLAESPDIAEQTRAAIDGHATNGTTLLWLSLAMAPLAWLFAGFASGRFVSYRNDRSLTPLSAAEAASPTRTAVLAVAGTLVVGLAITMVFFVVRAGHSGAAMIWGP